MCLCVCPCLCVYVRLRGLRCCVFARVFFWRVDVYAVDAGGSRAPWPGPAAPSLSTLVVMCMLFLCPQIDMCTPLDVT